MRSRNVWRVLLLVAALALVVTAMPLGAAGANGGPVNGTYPLYAGQDILVGELTVTNDTQNLYVTFDMTGDYCMTETHLQVGDLEDVQKNGNPIPGKFEYSMDHDCVDAYKYPPIPLDGLTGDIEIAAHAEVRKTVSNSIYGITIGSAKLHEIDLASCSATEIAAFVDTGGPSYPNSLAYDDENARLFYAGSGNTPLLYVYDSVNTSVPVPNFRLPTPLADAAFYGGSYYYVAHGSGYGGDLYKVDVDFASGVPTGASAEVVNAVGASIYGDIAIDSSGMLYGSGLFYGTPSGIQFFNVQLGTTNTPGYVAGNAAYQLAYDGLGRLVGTANQGSMLEISTADGSAQQICSSMGTYTDLSDGPGAEFEYETAWSAGTDFPGKNWATYSTYTLPDAYGDVIWTSQPGAQGIHTTFAMFEGLTDLDGYGSATQTNNGNVRVTTATCVRIDGNEVNWGGYVTNSTVLTEIGQPIIGWAKDGATDDMMGGWLNGFPSPCSEAALTWNGGGTVTSGNVVVGS